MHSIELRGTTISYKFKPHHSARVVRIRVRLGGEVVVTGPRRLTQKGAEKALVQKADWLLEKLSQQASQEVTDLTIRCREHYLAHKETARRVVHERAEVWAPKLQVAYKMIRIKNPTSIWGSCSESRNLNFNYKIIFLPEEIQDYLVVHELCHLIEMNHSPRFWKLVESLLPDYRERQKVLRKIGF